MEKLNISGRFAGKTVIITGSSRGIGRGVALGFAAQGANVVVHGQDETKLKETAKAIEGLGVSDKNYLIVQGAIQDQTTQEKLIQEAIKKFGNINVLVNNAAVSHKDGLDPNSAENLDFIYQVNLRSVYTLTNLAIPYLIKTKGNVVNISSVGSQKMSDGLVPYCMLKAALDHFTRGAALRHAKDGIRINTVSPGGTETDFVHRHGGDAEVTRKLGEKWKNLFVPMNRFATPGEVANIVIFVASDDASYVTGANINVDGGVLAGIPSSNWMK
ncbi:unnamed protein product [Bursaphelenchus xylophilus]|uniref:(pine wood nematode) hypothetical protein n=1 Tax=Bursaphelenchus xylophilus TaxID=6326 RepID=A0A1I7RXE2_BURXY|nr:unnamed protein product [Bursaphelenchus xylophilus]CAG9126320.1 unnamed protein product [Bursaphelenchus xylophilus]